MTGETGSTSLINHLPAVRCESERREQHTCTDSILRGRYARNRRQEQRRALPPLNPTGDPNVIASFPFKWWRSDEPEYQPAEVADDTATGDTGDDMEQRSIVVAGVDVFPNEIDVLQVHRTAEDGTEYIVVIKRFEPDGPCECPKCAARGSMVFGQAGRPVDDDECLDCDDEGDD